MSATDRPNKVKFSKSIYLVINKVLVVKKLLQERLQALPEAISLQGDDHHLFI